MALADMMKTAKKPKFEDDGPPAMVNNESRGSGGGESDNMVTLDDVKGDDYSSPDDSGVGGDVESQAADTLADLCGVSPDDRQDFAMALKTYVQACLSGKSSPDEEVEDNTEEG